MKIGIITGPGHHQTYIFNTLKSENMPYRYAANWPSLAVFDVDPNGKKTCIYQSKLYDVLSLFLWALWNKLPLKRKKSFHLAILYPLYDLIVSRFFKNHDLVICWSQVGLYSMKKIKKNGGRCILEHPMIHCLSWNNILLNEYREFDNQDYHNVWPNSLVRRMNREYKLADKINLLSTYAKKTFIDHSVPETKLQITHLGIETNETVPCFNRNVRNGKFIILYVGRIEYLKGIYYLLEAFQQLNLEKSELWLVGPISKDVNWMLEKYKGNYKYLGVKNRTELEVIYKEASIFVFPTLMDAFGLVILEAMYHGLPVITTESSGGPDIIKNGKNGFIVPSRNIEELKVKIRSLFMDKELYNKFIINGLQTVKERFDLNNYREKINILLHSKSR